MSEFWEDMFKREEMIWGQAPSDSAIKIKDFFLDKGISKILIPGIGYGRNAKVFHDNGFDVTGIEISQSAIDQANELISPAITIYCGSATDMPFDNRKYDGIFCYSLIHLLNKAERNRFLKSCYNQLNRNAYMCFTVVSKNASMFGYGNKAGKNRYKLANGLKVFFYDEVSIKKEFGDFGLELIEEINEPIKHMDNEPPLKCYLVICYKKE